MKRQITTLAALLFVAIAATAQINIGIKAGTNFPTVPTNIEGAKSGNVGWFAGPTLKAIIPVIGLGAEANILYSNAGTTINEETYNRQSIEVPLYLRYELQIPAISRIFEPFIAVGPQWGWTVGKKEFGVNPNEISNMDDLLNAAQEKGRYFKFNNSSFSLNFGLGFILFNHLQVHANYNWALGETSQYTDYKNMSLGSITDNSIIKGISSSSDIWQVSLTYIF
jgi:hypothetical protein